LAAMGAVACGPAYPRCENDGDCREAEFCVNNTCQQCRDDGDCPDGHGCASGRCEPLENYCTRSGDCGVDEECRENRCRPKEIGGGGSARPEATAGPSECRLQPVYFGFDSSTLTPATREQLVNNSDCVKQKGISGLHVTGYADPRGTEEYNLALGDRRARRVGKYLRSLGVEANINFSSVGEEMARGHDESTWALDRKAQIERR
jgi:peptidoglycan-associated lipoprotein